MIKTKLAQELYDSWINGNRSDVRNKLKNKSKLFILDFVYFIGTQTQGNFKGALHEVYGMIEK